MRNFLLALAITIILIIQNVQAYIFDTQFLLPLQGTVKGSVVRTDDLGNPIIQFFDETQVTKTGRNLQQSLPYPYDVNTPEVRAMKLMYWLIGIEHQNVTNFYIPNQINLLNGIDWWYSSRLPQYKKNTSNKQPLIDLKQRIVRLKQFTDRIINTYLSDINMVIIGNRISGIGKKIFVNGNNLSIRGNRVMVMYENNNRNIKGDNILRSKNFQFNFNQIDSILTGDFQKCLIKLPKKV